VAQAAARRGVEVKAVEHGPQYVLVLGFAAVDAKEIRRGVRALGEAINEVRGKKKGGA
jgi:DNA-binding transcriptional MocR family regulator